MIIEIDEEKIKQSLLFLKKASAKECVILWLAEKQKDLLITQEVYLPEQVADRDYFHIPRKSIADLLKHLRQHKLVVAAQVHTHPAQAFHSAADDRWAIIGHVGGLSLVLPYFASSISVHNFVAKTAIYRLSENSEWMQVPTRDARSYYRIVAHGN